MHANHRRGLRRHTMIDEIELDHRVPLVGIALGTGLYTGVAADASAGVDEEFLVLSYGHGYSRLCADVLHTLCIREFSKSGLEPQWSTDLRSCARPSDKE